MKITQYVLNKKTVAYVLTWLILAGGIYAYEKLGRLEFPDFTIKTAIVSTRYPGATPLETEQEVTDLLETAIQKMSQIKEIRSISRAGLSIIYVDIKDEYVNEDMPQIWDELRRKVNDVQTQLPPGAGPSLVNDDFGDVYGVFYAVYGDGFTYSELKDYADLLRRELLLVRDVAAVELFGQQPEVVYLEMSRARMAQLGICLNDILNTFNQQEQVVDAGRVVMGDDYVRLHPSGGNLDLDELNHLVVRCGGKDTGIYLKDIMTIHKGYLDPPMTLMHYNGHPAIGIGIATTSDGNVVEMGKAVQKRISELTVNAPVGMELGVVAMQSETVTKAVKGFVTNLIEAVVIVLLVLCLTMGWASGILMGAALLLTIFGTFVLMKYFEVNLQNISLGALILALGMLVDNAIVITEGILVRIRSGMERNQAAMETVSQTAWPLLGATLVAILAFAAIGTSRDTTGEFLNSLFVVMAISLGLSWIVAITLIPLFCVRFLPPPDPEKTVTDPYSGRIFRAYRRMLSLCLQHRMVALGILSVIFLISMIGFSRVEQSFFPGSDRPQFKINFFRPEGTHIRKTAADIGQIETYVASLESVTATASFIGSGALRFILTYEPEMPNSSYGQVLVTVDDYRKIDQLIPKIRTYLREHFPDAEYQLEKFVIGPGGGAKIEAKFSGPDPVHLRKLADRAKGIMASDPLAITIKDDWRQQVQIIEPLISEPVARRTGITRPVVANALAVSSSGKIVGLFREGDDLLPVIFRLPEHERRNAGQIYDVQVLDPNTGTPFPLSAIVKDTRMKWENPIIRRTNRKRTITAQCDPAYGNASVLFNRLRPQIESIPLPQGYELTWGGEYKDSKEANESLMRMVPVFLLAMALIILTMFNSIRQTLIVFLCLPLAVIGVASALLAIHEPFGFMCLLGFLGLSGMLIKNAVVLLEQIQLDMDQGKDRLTAILDASVSRLRPVVMAALTTVLGMLPLVRDPMFSGMSITIIGGLTFGTVLTLVVVPVLYAVFYKAPRQPMSGMANSHKGVPPVSHSHDKIGKASAAMTMMLMFSSFVNTPILLANPLPAKHRYTVDQVVDQSLKHSYLLQSANFDTQAATQTVHSARSRFLPEITGNYSYTNLKDQPYRINGNMQIPMASRQTYHRDVTVIQPLFTGFALTANLDMARIDLQVKTEQKRQTLLDVTRDAKVACYDLLLANKLYQVADQHVLALKAQEADAEKFFHQELIPLNDWLRYQVALSNAIQNRENAAANVYLAQTRIRLLMGTSSPDPIEIEDVTVYPEITTDLSQILNMALANRPMLEAARLGLSALHQAVVAAQSEHYPQVSAFWSYEQNGDDPAANSNEYTNDHNSSVGIQVQWSLFQWGRTRANVARSRAQLRSAQSQVRLLEDQVRLEVETTFRNLLVAKRNISTACQSLAQAKENRRITELQYAQQLATSTDVLNAQAAMVQADTNYYQALYGYATRLADLERVTGTSVREMGRTE